MENWIVGILTGLISGAITSVFVYRIDKNRQKRDAINSYFLALYTYLTNLALDMELLKHGTAITAIRSIHNYPSKQSLDLRKLNEKQREILSEVESYMDELLVVFTEKNPERNRSINSRQIRVLALRSTLNDHFINKTFDLTNRRQ
ncbi:hypothetical protein [Shouchella lehensis]|uniref:Uncharacterized protein n=1 Tax=Shouchella lehensis TaxID=300825 RepID=A0A4Y7WJ07_9BACI|nr:hypothetical protein [Shouchella lehensis]MBG9785618.1 hypothetical protein [Shouchella lehensis]TES48071.1 hypothetical protein E2L03_13125 [Shouchella lehensis]